ncbi:MAG: RNase adapter RapZ [Burkholderiales bacterium]|nr:RNase adapter RapZ [Burkholderiales bacterium]OJX05815.1 MAG: RNase adaptor protein RapZ [Burkholderiales bacterium 70-64]
MRVVLVTGISGSGKSIAIKVLEDDGFFCIDNLPLRFLHEVIMSLQESGHEKVAVSVDARSGDSVGDLREIVSGLGRYGHDVKLIFLNARTDTLVQRYSETRRRHPMSLRAGDSEGAPTLIESIERERELMSVIEDIGVSLDTSDLHPNVLRSWVRDVVGTGRAALTLLFESFAYKYGVPLDADLVFDVRCLPNPYYTAELRPLTGLDEPVAEYLRQIPSVQRMIEHIANFLHTWLPHYILENRSYLTVAIGCTGGQHRSVYCVEELARRFRRIEHVLVRHRALAARQAAGS